VKIRIEENDDLRNFIKETEITKENLKDNMMIK
jgi:hypothetical protein